MKCTAARDLIFRKFDNELSESETAEFDAHLAECPSCTREYRLLTLPSRIAQAVPPPKPSPFFYRKLSLKLEGEARDAVGWQFIFGLARQVIPALAGITLALLSVFIYVQLSGHEPDLYKAYDRVFISDDQSPEMLSQLGNPTDEGVLGAIAERESNHRRSLDRK